MRIDRIAVLAAAVLVLGGAAGCSSVGGGGAAGDGPADPAPASSARPSTPKAVVEAAADALDKAGSARLRVEEDNHQYGHSTVEGAVSWTSGDADLTVTEGRGKGRLRLVDGVHYASYDWLAPDLKGKHWARAERETAEELDSGATPGRIPASFTGIWLTGITAGPAAPLRLMAEAGQITEVGQEQLDGATVTHYRGTASVAAYHGADQGLSEQERAATLAYYQRQGMSVVDHDYWLDQAGRLLKSQETTRGSGGTDTVVELVAEPGTDVAAPAPDAVDTLVLNGG
ncbi:hypothetical protein AB0D08_14130 [Kitasatospora sp. NPDC048540]|uniref:hypothetical protein n=1 Tax=unclassified Kitasatospora TaxID=2633591 RepID=UPI00053A7A94|nr:hypothetical protein [Kitasatospora sp. MBT63]